MYAKNDYCVQVRGTKGWRYYSKFTRSIYDTYSKYIEARNKFKEVRVINATEHGYRVSKII